ncbi:membrane protein [Thermosipho sp. 1063]|uniref:AI-2E family transporter n=1 Tax=unclassified Thermosipho (in: thermotogales) TaxID=2676525 RepID=UPI00095089DF|nr:MULTISPECIES: AI-2E family transporter [unclassified Thermosipho (in: thermotogales)]APT72817.1 membrane protein [Thermosipho sp. 1063]OOC42251.1 membrane protein [Thermosipho sp. 1074]
MLDSFILLFYFVIFLIILKISPFVLGAVVIGFYISIVLDVPAKYLSRKLNPKLSKVISYSLLLSLIFYSSINFFPIIFLEGKKIFSELTKLSIPNNTTLPKWLLDFINNSNRQISNFALNIFNKIISFTPSLITMVILITTTTVAVANLKEYLKKRVKNFFIKDPEKGYNFIKKFYKDFEKFVSGQVIIAMLVGLIVGILAWVFKIKGAFFLGVISFITDFIPFLGVVIVSIPMLMLGYSSLGIKGIIISILILALANQLESWVFAPKIQSENFNIHWFILIISLLIFGDILGFIGILIAIPSLLFIKRYWLEYILGGNYGKNR